MPPRVGDREPGNSSRRMSDLLICFSCCATEQPPPKRRRIDRSMIGLPTNFMHTGHIGSGDMSQQQEQQEQNNHLNSIQVQMQSKGGYSESGQVEFQRDVMEIKRVPDKQFFYDDHVAVIMTYERHATVSVIISARSSHSGLFDLTVSGIIESTTGGGFVHNSPLDKQAAQSIWEIQDEGCLEPLHDTCTGCLF